MEGLQKGDRQSFSHAEKRGWGGGGHTSFEDVVTQVFEVLAMLKGGGHKQFPALPLLPIFYDRSLD